MQPLPCVQFISYYALCELLDSVSCMCVHYIYACVRGSVAQHRRQAAYSQRREGWMALCSREVGVRLRTPNYSRGSHSLPASPLAPVFGCIFAGRVRWYAPAVSEALVSGGGALHLSAKHHCVWLAGLNEIPSYLAILSFSLLTAIRRAARQPPVHI